MVHIKISNSFVLEITWEGISGCAFRINNQADIWRINISSIAPSIHHLSSLLTNEEVTKAGRFLHRHDSDRFIISRALLKLIMSKYLNIQPNRVEIDADKNKKPFIKNSPLFYNMSHSGDWIILAVADSPIGIDTELINNSFDFGDVINEYFSVDESSFISESDSTERFFLLWTRKEAITKASGQGLDENFKFIPSLDGEYFINRNILSLKHNLALFSFKLADDYFISAAINSNITSVKFWEINELQNPFTFLAQE
jgi:4'-phosphopantetheinyl transferase